MAAQIWNDVPPELFSDPLGRTVYASVDQEVQAGTVSPERLARGISDPAVSRVVLEALSRVETQGGSNSEEYEMVWDHCQRDLTRWKSRFRLEELAQRKRAAREKGDTEEYRQCREEYSQLLKEMKR